MHALQKLKRRYLAYRWLEIVLWSSSVTIVFLGVSRLVAGSQAVLPALLLFVAATGGLAVFFRMTRYSDADVTRYLNARYPQLQESADLLVREMSTLTTLEQIQLEKTRVQLQKIFPEIRVPHHLGRAIGVFAGSVAISVFLSSLNFREERDPIPSPEIAAPAEKTPAIPAAMKTLTLRITPPAYTQLKQYTVDDPGIKVPEGSMVTWQMQFNNPIQEAFVSFSGNDTIVCTAQNGIFLATKKITVAAVYQVNWRDTNGRSFSSDFFRIDVALDQEPHITFEDLPQIQELTPGHEQPVEIRATLSDDHSVTDSYIIATVAKGSGESVKFREEKIYFTKPSRIAGKKVFAHRVIDVRQLGLQAGDELYFYGEVTDSKSPIRQRGRTETYFISLTDTASRETVADAGLGVDLMPEYFRSQRQIIIDTEKLLRNRKRISRNNFNFTSNELGYDQKVLRLKYGEFLGEEFESELAASGHEPEPAGEDSEDAKPVEEEFGHAHDKDNDHSLVEGQPENHQHEEDPEGNEAKDPLKEFVHAHDDSEEATFFLQSVRTKLKAALAQMWDAELYLRLYQPEKSLPYQYKALKLLKEVSNDSRIYVHRTGFDPPPIKEEKRLTADLNEVKSSTQMMNRANAERNRWIKEAVAILENKISSKVIVLSSAEKLVLERAGQELVPIAIENPGEMLPALSLLRNMAEDRIPPKELLPALLEIRQIIYRSLADDHAAQGALRPDTQLDRLFIKHLKDLNNE